MVFFDRVFWLASLRCLILLRQKLGWMSLIVGGALIPLVLIVARVSFVGPAKIFWDFSLGISFLLQIVLASYLGSHVLDEERARKTLHVLCAGRMTRVQWVWGQVLGTWAFITAMNFIWLLVSAGLSKAIFADAGSWIHLQTQIFVAIEVAIVVGAALLLSMFLRSALAWMSLISVLILLHSVSYLLTILKSQIFQVSGEAEAYEYLFKALYFLPPLEWLDLRVFVGYEEFFEWSQFLSIGALGVAWSLFFVFIAQRRIERLDF